jgi:molecular chaperone Hsp33
MGPGSIPARDDAVSARIPRDPQSFFPGAAVPKSTPLGRVTVHRSVDDARGVMAAEGDFTGLIEGYLEHVDRWESHVDGLTLAMMRQGLAATALHLSFRPADESAGITLNVAEPPVNVFLGGDAGRRTVTGRAFVHDVQTGEASRLFVQAHRAGTGMAESVIEVEGLDVLEIFEQFFERSVQSPARFFEPEESRFVMVLGLPGADKGWMDGLTRESVGGWLEGGLRLLDDPVFRFRCGCTAKKMLRAVRGMFADRPGELFAGEPGVEVLCPRCGTRWWLTRGDFEGGYP